MKVGDIINQKYEVLHLINENGVGQLYEARHQNLGYRVAIRVLHPDVASKGELVETLFGVVTSLAEIGSEQIARLEERGTTDDGEPYIVTEFVEGSDLATLLTQEGPLEPSRISSIIAQACQALAAAHEKGIFHLGLTPRNLMVGRGEDGTEHVKITDFGLGPLHESLPPSGAMADIPFYMSPEQLRESSELDGRADVYSIGVVLYEMLTGQRPFQAVSRADLSFKVSVASPKPPRSLRTGVHGDLNRIVLQSMAKEPRGRFANMSELAEALIPHAMGDVEDDDADATMVLGDSSPASFGAPPSPPGGPAAAQPPKTMVASGPPVTPSVAGSPAFPQPMSPPGPGAPPKSDSSGSAVKWIVGIAVGVIVLGMLVALLIFGIGMFTMMRSADPPIEHTEVVEPGPNPPLDPLPNLTPEPGPGLPTPGAKSRVDVNVYVMSQCPYGVKVENTLTALARKMGPGMHLELDYIGRDQGGELTSMHGDDEVAGDKLQLCVSQHAPYNVWLSFLDCQNRNWRSIPQGWEACATETGVDVETLRTCYESSEAVQLLRDSFARSAAKGARGSPTIFIGGEKHSGSRSERVFAQAVCRHFTPGSEPSYCREVPAGTAVPVKVLTDRRCTREGCDAAEEIQRIKGYVPAAKIETVDYNSVQGQMLFALGGIKVLPAVFIGSEVDQESEARTITRGAKKVGAYYVKVVGRFDPLTGVWAERPEVGIRILVDGRCKSRECTSVDRFESFIKRQIPNGRVTRIDYSTAEGSGLWQRLKIAVPSAPPPKSGKRRPLGLPVALFAKSVEDEPEAFNRLERRFINLGDEYLFQLGAWNPESEICDNSTDDDGDGTVDCADSDCRGTKACRAEVQRSMKVYVMSQCPYGIKVLNAMGSVLANFGRDRSKMNFRIEFIGRTESDGSLYSMHGQAEVEENLRQICAQHHYPDNYAFMDYVLCRNKNIRSADWRSCVRSPMNEYVVQECAEGQEGRRLLVESFEEASTLGMSGSPSWLLNNRYEMRGRDPEAIKSAYCEHNSLPECSNVLSSKAP